MNSYTFYNLMNSYGPCIYHNDVYFKNTISTVNVQLALFPNTVALFTCYNIISFN